MAWQQPKTNWDTHPKAIEPEDLNRIEGNIKVVRETVDIPLRMEVVDSFPPHTAGRMVYHSGNKKAYISDGSQWVPIGIEGDAEAKHVLEGKTFSSQVAGAGAVGSMPDRGAVTITPGTSNKTIPAGYHNGQGYVKGDSKLVSKNIVEGISIFGVNGSAKKVVTGSFNISAYETKTINIGFKADLVLCCGYKSTRTYWAVAFFNYYDETEFVSEYASSNFRISAIGDTYFRIRYSIDDERVYGTYWAY